MRSIRLLQQVEHLGIENILATNSSARMVSPLAMHSSNIYTRYNSPMTQLTSLKHLSEKKKTESESSVVTESNSKSEAPASSSSQAARTKQKFQRQKSRRSMNAGQRRDLGTVNNANKAEKSDSEKVEEKSLVGGFVGSISSIFFGRKGGLL